MLHVELEAPDIFTAQRKGENITNNIHDEYNCYVQSIIEEKEPVFNHEDCENYYEETYDEFKDDNWKCYFKRCCKLGNNVQAPKVCQDFNRKV